MVDAARFNSLLASTAKRFDVEICALSLQDGQGSWELHGNMDASLKERAKESKLFKVLVSRAAPTVILDAQRSGLIKDDVMVVTATGSPQLRLYVEVPLVDGTGVYIGALILADQAPRLEDLPVTSVLELTDLARTLERKLRGEPNLPPRSKTGESSELASNKWHQGQQPRSFTTLSARPEFEGNSEHFEFKGKSANLKVKGTSANLEFKSNSETSTCTTPDSSFDDCDYLTFGHASEAIGS
eukprot:TRINITY_DN16354_c0_g2_i1.p1 TRINITY_DN16354_c0_g2~~TRINITY_DN16354_c0_g2_i1.p1  ORF type:complete len:242 (-),score=40.99 TRINITY_DN16354_c0_g2_i1:31-756(-)